MSVKLVWYGHATWGIESDGKTLIMDPFFTDNPSAPIKAEEVKADFILVSHGHFDHVSDLISIAKRTGATVISNFEIITWCQQQGIENAHPMHIGGGHDFPFGRLQLTAALHGSVLPDGTYGGNPCGLLIHTGGKTIYNAADTGLFSDMKLLGERNKIDAALLPIGDNFTMGPDDALYAVKLIRPTTVLPMHYNTFEVIQQDAAAFAKRVESDTESKCVVLQPGESHTL